MQLRARAATAEARAGTDILGEGARRTEQGAGFEEKKGHS